VVNAGETALAFYKVYNRSDKPIAGIAVYQVFPEEVSLYFHKIQCFCFENQLLYPQESVDLPILFYLDPAINYDANLSGKKDVLLTYHFFPSADQSIAEVLQKEIEKNNEDQKKLVEMRANLKTKGIVLEEPKYPANALGQGHNPKESPQMYVEKILKNQKRMERTIQMYEENQKKH
jgi:cytochrome c oxidase assembly protein subunit 11